MIGRYGAIAISTHTVLSDKIYVLYNGFLLFTVIMLYNIVKNIELKILNHCFQGKTRVGSCEPLITFLFNPYIILFYLCFCFQTSYLIYIIDSLALNSSQQNDNVCLNEAYLTHMFSHSLLMFKKWIELETNT